MLCTSLIGDSVGLRVGVPKWVRTFLPLYPLKPQNCGSIVLEVHPFFLRHLPRCLGVFVGEFCPFWL